MNLAAISFVVFVTCHLVFGLPEKQAGSSQQQSNEVIKELSSDIQSFDDARSGGLKEKYINGQRVASEMNNDVATSTPIGGGDNEDASAMIDSQQLEIHTQEDDFRMNKNTFFIFNKVYDRAKIAQWGTDGRDVGTYEQGTYPSQLWYLEESTRYPGYYYINNAHYEGYRLAKWGSGDYETGVYNGQYYDSQLWRFRYETEGYFRIYNKDYSSARITKFGKSDSDFGTYAQGYYDDQLWKLVPRFQAAGREVEEVCIDNREGTHDITRTVKLTKGMKLASSQTLTTRFGYQYSLTASLSASAFGADIGVSATQTLSFEIERSTTSSEEKYWSREVTQSFTAPAGKVYRVMQIHLFFTSLLSDDDSNFFDKNLRIVENETPCTSE